jgi:uncharacterized membrane protein YgcG
VAQLNTIKDLTTLPLPLLLLPPLLPLLLLLQLSGTIPSSWGSMPSLRFISLHDNPLLSGCVPAAWKGRVRFQGKGTNFDYKSSLYESGVLENTGITGWCSSSSSSSSGSSSSGSSSSGSSSSGSSSGSSRGSRDGSVVQEGGK